MRRARAGRPRTAGREALQGRARGLRARHGGVDCHAREEGAGQRSRGAEGARRRQRQGRPARGRGGRSRVGQGPRRARGEVNALGAYKETHIGGTQLFACV